MSTEEYINPEVVESMGISQPAYQEILHIVGHIPTIEQLCTLLAMWEANGKQQSLLAWLKGQPKAIVAHDYLYDTEDEKHNVIKEPRVKECIEIAHSLCPHIPPDNIEKFDCHGDIVYMVGNVAPDFLDSEYARKYLHLVSERMSFESDTEDMEYHRLILTALRQNEIIKSVGAVAEGGLFVSLIDSCPKEVGFTILTCREIRLDSFLFGERPGRFIVSLSEKNDDLFLTKMDEAKLNCCFLGRVTHGRVLVDDMDFGNITSYK